ncbi:MAG TPA: transporter substrate-binding domain-containing protein [Rhodoblastus sp.]|nr:transporter substrate-binding domain-containing protein [Rhodoblastus sp.]
MNIRKLASFAAISLAAVTAALGPAVAAGPVPLRLCADPDNLPLSSENSATPGVYVEIGEAIGKALGRPVSMVWYRTNFGKRAVRVTMLANQCDATIGLPQDSDFMGPRVIFSKPLFKLGYVLVTPKDFEFKGLSSLIGKRVAVQFSTTPHNMIGPREDITSVTVLSPEEGMKKLAEGKADIGFLWGAHAGYLNATAYGDKYKLVSVDGPALQWPTAIGFAKESSELRDKIDALLPDMKDTIAAVMKKYGLPVDQPVKFGELAAVRHVRVAAMGETAFQVAQAAQPATAPAAAAPAAPSAPPAAAPAGNLAEGKEVFNGTCAHCHGPDAVQSEKKIDLRRLTIRYGDDMKDVFWKTVHDGRPSKGMPAWKEVFTDEQLGSVLEYLKTLQSTE